jgi:transaldolase
MPGPSTLVRLHVEGGQSPWLDHLTRESLEDGSLARMVASGIRGVAADPVVLARAIAESPAYDEQLAGLLSRGASPEGAFVELAVSDVAAACRLLLGVHEGSRGQDGLVSLELPPLPTGRQEDAIVAAGRLLERIDQPNFLLAIPATSRGLVLARAMISAGRSVNVTAIFSTDRYSQVIDAYLSGLETLIGRGGDPSRVHSVASFDLRMVDAEVDSRLERLGDSRSLGLRGLGAVAQAKLAYRQFDEWFGSDRWARLARAGASPQRPLWTASAPADEDGWISPYVGDLIAPRSIHALSQPTADALLEAGRHGPALGIDTRDAAAIVSGLAARGVDLGTMAGLLERRSTARSRAAFVRAVCRLSKRRLALQATRS